MTALSSFFAWLENTSWSLWIRESAYAFPTIETLHVLALVLVVGSISIVDLRLLNIASRRRSVTALVAEVLPWTWTAFAVAVITGGLLFTSAPVKYASNGPFRVKILVLAAAGVNMGLFHLGAYRDVARWDGDALTPAAAKVAAGLSLLFWILAVSLGRWIGFTV